MKTALLVLIALISAALCSAQTIDMSDAIAHDERKNISTLRDYDLLSLSSQNFDVHYYRCEWNVNPAVRRIDGSVTSYFTITAATNSITFDLNQSMVVDSVIYHGSQINFVHNNNHSLEIIFPAMAGVNQKDSVSIYYGGVPAIGAFFTSTHSGTPIMYTLSEPYGARTWWPCKDMLHDKADSIDIIITSPSTFTASTNGLPVSETTAGGNKTLYSRHRYPIVAYLVAFSVTNYAVNTDMAILPGGNLPLVMYAYPENAASFLSATNTAKFFLENISPLISEYPFTGERYAQTQWNIGGGMEHQTNSFISSPNAFLVAHELGHQWFGDKVTCGSWSDLWLNEGFASYTEFLYVEAINPASRLNFLQSWRGDITSQSGGSVFVIDTLNENRLFNSRLTYHKGGYLVHMLRGKLGDSVFFRGIRRYLNDPLIAYKTARTSDLQRNLETESGQDLTEFFEDWLYGQGHPNYSATWYQNSNQEVEIKLNQSSSHASVDFFEMPVQVQFRNASKDTIIRLEHNQDGEVFIVNPGFMADTVIIDPELWILTGFKTSQKTTAPPPPPPPPSAPVNVVIYPNPSIDALTIQLSGTATTNLQVQLFNSLGQMIHSEEIASTASQATVQLKAWPSGIYWVRLTDGKDLKVIKKFVIVRD